MTASVAAPVLLGIDYGSKRIGLATARGGVRLSVPHTTIPNDGTAMAALSKVVSSEGATQLVVGLPRGLSGQPTAQTAAVEAFAAELRRRFGLPVRLQDEALTSVKAEAELKSRGKPFAKAEVDSLAAAYILQDYLESGDV